MKPVLRFLDPETIERILAEAREVLARLGVEIHNTRAVELLTSHGARLDEKRGRVLFPAELIDQSLGSAPRSFRLHDVRGEQTHELGGENVYFTPGSTAIHILDHGSGRMRKPSTGDYVRYARLVSGLGNIAAQSTAFIPDDVPAGIQDLYRLYLSLMICEKPVVTGAFGLESLRVMVDFQLAVRGSEEDLRARPLCVFSCCPSAPLKWSEATSQNLLDCARYGIPVELISMPLAGFVAPVTLVGSLIQHTAETLSGLVLSQLARPGAPVLYGGSPAIFDVRYGTTPMGAPETMMLDCAYAEIGRHLGLPTQAYISLSDAKQLDAQAGGETSMGATLAALAGINSISGPGMLDFESCQSLEKLLVDNEIAGMALRLARGITPREDFPALPRFEELVAEGHLLISPHTRRHLGAEHFMPGPVVDRASLSRWQEDGASTLGERAHREVERLVRQAVPARLPEPVRADLTRLMETEARRHGMDRLPGWES